MRWRGRRASANIEDRRGAGRSRMPRGAKGGGIGVIVLVLIAAYFGVDPSVILDSGPAGGFGPADQGQGAGYTASPAEQELADFVAVVVADTEDAWHTIFRDGGQSYREPTLVLFSGAVQSTCGFAQSAMGPFYCPGDEKVYIDLSFYHDLRERYGAPGDFAQAYVIAHEVGHHVQTLLGISERVHAKRRQVSEAAGNELSVRQELQADCLAGMWAHHTQRTKQVLEEGDIEEALRAASSIGDDRMQRQSRGYVTPESFTHGTSAQRMRWFRRGFEQGKLSACDTFGTDVL